MDAASILIGNCACQTKAVAGFVNKMFKMGDKYLAAHNDVPGQLHPIGRARINASFEAFRKKKEALKGAAP